MRSIILLLGTIFFTMNLYANSFTLTSSAFQNGNPFPILYTCDGKDISPPLNWENPPEKTRAFALILSDPDAPVGVWYHWVIYNIPASIKELAQNAVLPSGTLAGKNSWGKSQYNGPCPPKDSSHHYIFTLYALDASLNLSENEDINSVLSQVNNHILQSTQLVSVYGK